MTTVGCSLEWLEVTLERNFAIFPPCACTHGGWERVLSLLCEPSAPLPPPLLRTVKVVCDEKFFGSLASKGFPSENNVCIRLQSETSEPTMLFS